ncbi:hypothetical protein L596_011701 [Steinernema carpocapsae]|uniref:Uncharacterized protein n=1 Tax=Steinernema carpocapsae TaxID=34508 RepID=A0A4U5NV68_STECR|nr:hypothetical protein L596_011701 [Steinernema carpocapsae]
MVFSGKPLPVFFNFPCLLFSCLFLISPQVFVPLSSLMFKFFAVVLENCSILQSSTLPSSFFSRQIWVTFQQ